MSWPQKILLVEPGHQFGHTASTIETFRGYADAFAALGLDVWEYNLADRLRFFEQANRAINPKEKITLTQLSEAATESIAVAALTEKVDLILYVTAQNIPPRTFRMIREALKVPQGIIFTESPYCSSWELERLKICDFAFTNDEACVERYRKINKNIFFLSQGYRQDVFEKDIAFEPLHEKDIFFVGTIFPKRQIFLNEICERFPFREIGLYGIVLKPSWKSDRFRMAFTPETLSQEEYAKFLKGTKIALCPMREYRVATNACHIVPTNPGPRFFEILAMGTFCITEWREGLERYGSGKNFETYKETEECLDKIRFYLDHDDKRKRIAARGRKRVYGKESFLCRAREALKTMQSLEW